MGQYCAAHGGVGTHTRTQEPHLKVTACPLDERQEACKALLMNWKPWLPPFRNPSFASLPFLSLWYPSLIPKAVMVTHTEKSLTLSAADPNLPVLLLGAFRRQSFIHSIVLAGSYGAQSIDWLEVRWEGGKQVGPNFKVNVSDRCGWYHMPPIPIFGRLEL